MPDTNLTLYRRGRGLSLFNYLNSESNTIPTYYYGENSLFRVFLTNIGEYGYSASGTVTFNVSFGNPGRGPLRGEWRIGTGAATGSAVSFNATTTQLLNAISGVYGNVGVTTYGSAITAGYIITAATANTALTMSGQSLSLTPSSSVDVLDLVSPSTGVTAQKLVRLRRKPAVSLTAFINTATLSSTSISASGPSSTCGPWYLLIPDDAKRYPQMITPLITLTGSVTSSDNLFGGFFYSNEAISTLSDNSGAVDVSPGKITKILENIPLITTSSAGGRIPVYPVEGSTVTFYGGHVRDFVNIRTQRYGQAGFEISATPVTSSINTAITLSASSESYMMMNGIYSIGVVTFSGADLDEAFRESRQDFVNLTLEITMEENSAKTVLLQAPATIVRNIA